MQFLRILQITCGASNETNHCRNNDGSRNAVSTTEETFGKDANIVAGSKYLLDALVAATEDSGIAKGILDKIFRIIGKGDHIQWLTRGIMKEYTFRTMTDNEDIYCYDNEKGVYVVGQEWRIKDLSQLMYTEITTHQLHEVINQIKRRTYVDRSKFDSNPDIINLKNGLLNIHTKELTPIKNFENLLICKAQITDVVKPLKFIYLITLPESSL